MQHTQSEGLAPPASAVRHRPWTLDRIMPYIMIAPSVIAIGVFVYGFITWTSIVSMSEWRGIVPDYTFTGLENYARIFSTARFQTNIRNTIVFTALFLSGCLGIGLLLA